MASSREQQHLGKIALSKDAHKATKSLGGLLAGDGIPWEPRDQKEEEWKLDLEKNSQLYEEVETKMAKIFESLKVSDTFLESSLIVLKWFRSVQKWTSRMASRAFTTLFR